MMIFYREFPQEGGAIGRIGRCISMKHIRFLLTAALILALLASVAPAAFADILYPAPSALEAGTPLNHLVASVDAGTALSWVPGALPPGVELVAEEAEESVDIYLRGTPQVQIWDLSRVNVGAQVGSGGLYNNQKNPSKPTCVADNKLGEWNTFYIKMVGDRVTVKLNGVLVVDDVILENY